MERAVSKHQQNKNKNIQRILRSRIFFLNRKRGKQRKTIFLSGFIDTNVFVFINIPEKCDVFFFLFISYLH